MWTDADRRYLKARLDNIERMIVKMTAAVLIEEDLQMAKIQDVVDKVNAQTTVIEGVTSLLDSLAQQVKDAGTDPAKLQEVVDNIQANTDKLANAVARDTAANDEIHADGM